MASGEARLGVSVGVWLATTLAVVEAHADRVPRGGAVVLDHAALVAYVADADGAALRRVDLSTLAVTSTPLPCAPEQALLVDDEHVAVTLRGCNRVAVVAIDAAGEGAVVASTQVQSDPWGLALTPRGELVVTSAWAHALTVLDAHSLASRFTVELPKEPRGIAVAGDGRRAYVTHLTGDAISVVDLAEEGAPRVRRLAVLGARYRNRVEADAGTGTRHPASALAFTAVLNEAETRLFVPHVAVQNGAEAQRFSASGYGGVAVEEDTSVSTVAVVGTRSETALGAPPEGAKRHAPRAPIPATAAFETAVAPQGSPARQARAAALLGDALFVASLGTDQLVELDARSFDPALGVVRTFEVGAGPTGVDVDAATNIAVVWSQFSHTLSIVSLGSGAVETTQALSDPIASDVAAGRALFFTERDRRTSRDGRACSACHPDGREDGLVWKLGSGPRQTPMLAGRLDKGPFGWLGKHATLEANMQETMMRLGGRGLPPRELGELAAFLRAGLRPPVRDAAPDARVARGEALFRSLEVGCTNCHRPDDQMSDRDLHDVGSATKTDRSSKFRTPPLVFLAGTAPYFHDGRYATLDDLLRDNLDRMGNTSQLSDADRGALVAYLRTL